jgi:tetratricopeptide (TPR) repeat protein
MRSAILQPRFRTSMSAAQGWVVAVFKLTAVMAISLIVTFGRVAVADDATPWALCVGDTVTETRIAACTTAIDAGRLDSFQLSRALQRRGCALINYSRIMFSAALTRREQGIRDLDEAIHLNSENATAYLCRGDYLADEKRFAEGISELDRAIQINPDLGAYVTRGSILDAAGRYDEAIDDFNQAEAIAPSPDALSWIHLHRAAAFSHKGDQAASRRDCGRAVLELTGGSGIGFGNYGISFECGVWAAPTP